MARLLFTSKIIYQCLVTFYTDHFAAFVMAAIGANVMRKPHLAAVRASNQLAGFECIVRSAAVPATFGNFTLWQRGHGLLLILL